MILVVALVVSNLVSFSVGQTLYGTRLAAYGYLELTNEVSLRGIDLINTSCVVIVVSRTPQTVLGKTYVITVGVSGVTSQASISWSQGDPDEKRVKIIFPQTLPGDTRMIRVKISS